MFFDVINKKNFPLINKKIRDTYTHFLYYYKIVKDS